MWRFPEAWGLTWDSSQGAFALLDAWIKGGLVLGLAWLLALVLRRQSAALRHLIWTFAIIGLLVLPFLTRVLPAWQLRVLPSPKVAEFARAPEPAKSPAVGVGLDLAQDASAFPRIKSGLSLELAGSGPSGWSPTLDQKPSRESHALELPRSPKPHQQTSRQWSGPTWFVIGWGVVAVAVLVPWVIGLLLLQRLRWTSRALSTPEWSALADAVSRQLNLRRRVQLRQGTRLSMPITWGSWRPMLLLPPGAADWPEAWRRAVLFHELAHVKRGDSFVQALAQWACALYWPNPLVWQAVRHLRLERERACDDLVLNAGSKPSDYAEQLLDFALRLPSGSCLGGAAIAMARRSALEGRVLAILDPKRNRGHVNRRWICAGAVALLGIALPMAAMRLADKENRSAQLEKASSSTTSATNSATQTPGQLVVEQQLARVVSEQLAERHWRFSSLVARFVGGSSSNAQVSIEGLRRSADRKASDRRQNAVLSVVYAGTTNVITLAKDLKPNMVRSWNLWEVRGTGELAGLAFTVRTELWPELFDPDLANLGWMSAQPTRLTLNSHLGNSGLLIVVNDFSIPDPVPLSRLPRFMNGDSRASGREVTGPRGKSRHVVDGQGKPAVGATVLLGTADSPVIIRNGLIVVKSQYETSRLGAGDALTTRTDDQGRFALSPDLPPEGNLIFVHDQGFAWEPASGSDPAPLITLQGWGRIEGRLLIGQQPGRHRTIQFYPAEYHSAYYQCVKYDYSTVTDEQGRFVFERVPPGWIQIGCQVEINSRTVTLTDRMAVKVEGGATSQVILGGTGRPVVGRFAAGNAVFEPVNFDHGDLRTLCTDHPRDDQSDHGSAERDWVARFQNPSDRIFAFRIDGDGAFRIENVPAGRYTLTISFESANKSGRYSNLRPYSWTIEVPPASGESSAAPFDVGILKLDVLNLITPIVK